MSVRLDQLRCAKCGREGKQRGFRYTVHGVYVCTASLACGKRVDKAAAASLGQKGNHQ